MKIVFSKSLSVVVAVVLLVSVFVSGSTVSMSGKDVADTTGNPSASGIGYDPWADINDDGIINIKDAAQLGARWMDTGTPLTKAYLAYDSGWVNITDKAGQYITITHDLGTMDGIVDITGKTTIDGGVHQRHLGGTNCIEGWNKTYGGTGEDYASIVVQTSDGGYALAGRTNSSGAGNLDFLLVKTDSAGNMQWNKTYGGTYDDNAGSVIQTDDDGYALAGYTYSFGAGSGDAWLVKTDAVGNMLWSRTYGGANNDRALQVVDTSDGGYALAGDTVGDFWLVKTDASGIAQWSQTYGGTEYDHASAVVQTIDGGYALTGFTYSYGVGSADFLLVKTDSAGNMQWNKTYGGIYDDASFHVVKTGDGGYALAGWTYSFNDGTVAHAWLVKTDSAGNMQWNQTYGKSNQYDAAFSVVQTNDGGYALAGETNTSRPEQFDFLLIKTDSAGNIQWNKTYGGAGDNWAWSVVQTTDRGYALAGWTNSSGAGEHDFWLVKTDSEGNMQGFKYGLAWTDSTLNTITLCRGATDPYWNYVRVRIWKIKETP
jgi:hypothetical protein